LSKQKTLEFETLRNLYRLLFNFSSSLIGKNKTRELLDNSYNKILPYFQPLKGYHIDELNDLNLESKIVTEKEFLSFTVWIQQFIKELKNFMVGLSKLEIQTITSEIKDELEEIGFYEFYEQATELEY
jgi:hypothetical protein